MRNHDEKTRDMARSILPATNRRSARFDANTIRRQNRRNTRQTLHVWARCDNALDFEGHLFDTDDPCTGGCGYSQTITEIMWDRRNHDKSGPLMRWAERLVETKLKDLPEHERRGWFKAILPDGLIGRHALSHLNHLFPTDDEFSGFRYRGPYLSDRERREQNKAAHEVRVDEFANRLREIIAHGHHKEFNRDLPLEVEPLAGLHDAERFARANLYRDAVERIIEKWENKMA